MYTDIISHFEQNMTLTLMVKGQFHGEYTLKSACVANIGVDLDTYTHILRHWNETLYFKVKAQCHCRCL